MPTIRTVCLSDLHLGADNSLLTHLDPDGIQDPHTVPPVLGSLGTCLRRLVADIQGDTPATLVLNGDLLETSLATTANAAMGFHRFVEAFFPVDAPARFARQLVYVPGNHDHHQWQLVQDIVYARALGSAPRGCALPARRHTTPIFGEPAGESTFVETLMRHHPGLADTQVGIAYPNFGLRSADGSRAVIFHHGHFIETIYRMMSKLLDVIFPDRSQPLSLEEIEAENGQWIDFFWSTLGSTGQTGADINLLYKALQDSASANQVVASLARGLAKARNSGVVGDWVEEAILKGLLRIPLHHISSSVRSEAGAVLNQDAQAGLDWYIGGPLRRALGDSLPPELRFVFGHTHKPFTAQRTIQGQTVDVYNTGGWVVDSEQPSSVFGGSAILVDEDLNVVNLRLYHEPVEGKPSVVHAESASDNPLLDAVRSHIDPGADHWAALTARVTQAVPFRNAVLRRTNQALARRFQG